MTRFLFTQEPPLIVLCPIVVRKTGNRQLLNLISAFLFQLPNPLLQEVPLWLLFGQGQSFLI